ncbi:Y-family DNA polymerase [Loktanella sp. DJP18]|uniref:Y-family DNA polymerase n=1 Tax=Loktanella sp. DJP18 TaxID=3409788 RepID=UPI003BB6126F
MTDASATCILPFPGRPARAAPQPAALVGGDNLRPAAPALLERAATVLDRAATALDPAALHPAASTATERTPMARIIRTAPTLNATPSGASPVMRRGGTEADGTDDGPATDRVALSRRIVSLHLADFAMARWLRWATARQDAPPDDLPVVMAVEGPHGPVVSATNRAATLAGLHAGARVVDMRALCPQVRVVRADPDGDLEALDKLALWARRWCPWTAVDGADGIVMDTTGSDHLWGGEPALLREIEGTLGALGFSVRLAMAPTHGAAWALARFGTVRSIATPATLALLTGPLPVRALRLDADTVLLLQRLGLKTVGDIAAVPRPSLARRFAQAPLPQNPLLRLDQLQGRLAEPVSARLEPPGFAVQARLPEPVQDPTPYLADLCAALCADLAAAGHGARRVTVTVYRTDAEVSRVTATTARASRDPAHLRRLFDDRLDRIDPGYGFELITLDATATEALHAVQSGLDGRADDGAALAQMVDRLSARLGAPAVRTPNAHASHIPERSLAWMLALSQAPGGHDALPCTDRPLRLLDTPEEIHVLYAVPEGPPVQFRWRHVSHRIARFVGPERIAPEWWNDRPGTRLRDYYRIEDDGCRRLWIYRDGVYGDAYREPPRWFVHGIFG